MYQEFSEKVKVMHFVLAPVLSKYLGFNITLVFNGQVVLEEMIVFKLLPYMEMVDILVMSHGPNV